MTDTFYPINHASLTFGPCRNFGLLEVSKDVYQAQFQGEVIGELTTRHTTRSDKLLEAMYMFNKAVQEKVIELNCLA